MAWAMHGDACRSFVINSRSSAVVLAIEVAYISRVKYRAEVKANIIKRLVHVHFVTGYVC